MVNKEYGLRIKIKKLFQLEKILKEQSDLIIKQLIKKLTDSVKIFKINIIILCVASQA
jgi:hypothetical protein